MFGRRISMTEVLPVLMRLSSYIKVGLDHYIQLKASGVEINPELLAAFLETQLHGWSPEIKGVDVLGGDAKHHLALFLASVIFNIGDKV